MDNDALLFLTNGFEEIEAITTIDILRRADIGITSVSLGDSLDVTGSHGITVMADILFNRADLNNYKMLILPGGPGHKSFSSHSGLLSLIKQYNDDNKYLAAICAAPSILGGLNLLVGKKAVCYPGFEDSLLGATFIDEKVVEDANIITSRGPGTALDFSLKIVEVLKGKDVYDRVKKALVL